MMSYPRLISEGFKIDNEFEDLEEFQAWITKITSIPNPELLASILTSNNTCFTSSNRKLRLMLANSIAQVLRLAMPNQPFTSLAKLQMVLTFILGQLAQGLQSLDVQEHEWSLQLLHCVASSKIFQLCSLLKQDYDIVAWLLSLLIPIAEQAVQDEERKLIVDLLTEVVDEPTLMMVPKTLVPVAKHILSGSELARALTFRGVENHFGHNFSKLLIELFPSSDDKNSKSEILCNLDLYKLVRELYYISPKLVEPSYHILSKNLRAVDPIERMECFDIVKEILIEDKADKNHVLLQQFLSRSHDVNSSLRLHFLHAVARLVQVCPHLIPEVTPVLQERNNDTDSVLRCELAAVCTLIILNNVSALHLLLTLNSLTQDKESNVRVEALHSLARIYHHHFSGHPKLNKSEKEAACLIFNSLLSHFGFTQDLAENQEVERLLNTFIFPNTMSVAKRTENLVFFLCGATSHALQAFQTMQSIRKERRTQMLKWLMLSPYNKKKAIASADCCNLIPDQKDRNWCFNALASAMTVNERPFNILVDALTDNRTDAQSDFAVEQVLAVVSMIHPELTVEIQKLRFYLQILYKGDVTKEYMENIMDLVQECIISRSACDVYGLNPSTFCQDVCQVIKVLMESHYSLFNRLDTFPELLFPSQNPDTITAILSIFNTLGAKEPLEKHHRDLAENINVKCKEIILRGDTAILSSALFIKRFCLFINVNLPSSAPGNFTNIFQMVKVKLDDSHLVSRISYILLLGYLASNLPIEQKPALKAVVSRKVVKELLMKPFNSPRENSLNKMHHLEYDGSQDVICKIIGIKTMSRWILYAQNEDLTSIHNTLRMMDAFLIHKGDLLDEGTLSAKDKGSLRLEAGLCILKICCIKDATNILTANQIQNLSQLMMDEDSSVRVRFAEKCLKRLCKNECQMVLSLPVLFVSLLSLGSLDPQPDFKQKVVKHIEDFFLTKRINSSNTMWPELCLFWLIPLLASAPCSWVSPDMTDTAPGWPTDNREALSRVRLALWSIMRPMALVDPRVSVVRMEYVLQKIKNCQDSMPTDSNSNVRLWTTCDLATELLEKFKRNLSTLRKSSPLKINLLDEPLPLNLLKPNGDIMFINTTNYNTYIFQDLPILSNSETNEDIFEFPDYEEDFEHQPCLP